MEGPQLFIVWRYQQPSPPFLETRHTRLIHLKRKTVQLLLFLGHVLLMALLLLAVHVIVRIRKDVLLIYIALFIVILLLVLIQKHPILIFIRIANIVNDDLRFHIHRLHLPLKIFHVSQLCIASLLNLFAPFPSICLP